MQEMNEKLAGAILMSNAQIESFFSGGSTEIVGELNGALGATATKFHQYPLGGVEIEDAVLTDIQNAFGAVEGSVAAASASIAAVKPLISVAQQFQLGTLDEAMSMPGFQVGDRGYLMVSPFSGDFIVGSSWTYELPSNVAGEEPLTRVVLHGAMMSIAGGEAYDLSVDVTKRTASGRQVFHIDLDKAFGSDETLSFTASNASGPITVGASGHMSNGVFDVLNFNGSANLGNMRISMSKSWMNNSTSVDANMEYMAGNTKATARLMQRDSLSAVEGVFTYASPNEMFLQVGMGSVSGTTPSGEDVSDNIGSIAFAARIKKPWYLSPEWFVVSKSWQNGTSSGGVPSYTPAAPAFDANYLWLSHDDIDSRLWTHLHGVISY